MTSIKTTVLALAFAAGTSLAATGLALADGHAKNPQVGGVDMSAEKPIVENAAAAPNLSTLVAAVKAAGLAETLAGDGPYTVFAPTNAAFEKLPAGTVETLLKPENKEQLKAILLYHVVPGKVAAADVVGLIKEGNGEANADTAGGAAVTLKQEGEAVQVVDANGNAATVTTADVMQSNGVVHVIDTVLLPKQ